MSDANLAAFRRGANTQLLEKLKSILIDIESKGEESSGGAKKIVGHVESALIKEIQKILLNTNQEIGGGTNEEIFTKEAFEKIQQNLIKWGFNDFYHFLGVDKNIEKEELRSACVKKIKEYQGAVGIKTDEKTSALFQLAKEAKDILLEKEGKKRRQYDDYLSGGSSSSSSKIELVRCGVKTEELMDYFGLGKRLGGLDYTNPEDKKTYQEGMMGYGEGHETDLQTILNSALKNIAGLEKQMEEQIKTEEQKIALQRKKIEALNRQKILLTNNFVKQGEKIIKKDNLKNIEQNIIPDFLFDQAKKRIQKELGKHYDEEKDCPENDREDVFKDVQFFIGRAKKAKDLVQVDVIRELASTAIKKEVISFLQAKIAESEISQDELDEYSQKVVYKEIDDINNP
ncbi:9398_t:CDS:2 [Cetraspora pellucida]|uniref:9398_t:CDS:1 n=1 Tax=Cetraspora pellucida TaxID=1433469 RepID=A0ACA9MZB4_9GLOM|nr:9398_t:CDS:2 [Cetraspora pellucida]